MIKYIRSSSCLKNEFIQVSALCTNWRACMSSSSNEAKSTIEIKIPNKIDRGPTDILQALSNTVKRDPTAAHYKYHDDPYFIPMSNVGKRTFAMAQEAGRKAAKWIVNEHSFLFKHKLSDPPIQAFFPKPVYNEESDVGEETLLKVINDAQVSDAIIIYGLLNQKGINVASTTVQSLLELVCFYNGQDSLPDELIEERWFTKRAKGQVERKTWKEHDVAEKLFKSLEQPTPEAYSAYIQGMLKYGQVEGGWQMYQSAQEKGILVDTGTYNALLNAACYIKQSPDLIWQQVQDLLAAMAKERLRPDIGTLNAALWTISTIASSKSAKEYILSLLSEFKALGVSPSLGSYHLILMTLCREKGSVDPILLDIMNEIETREFRIRHPQDIKFFSTAMDVCCNHLQDVTLAKRVDDLLHVGNNYDLIGDSYNESLYYRYFFMLLTRSEPLEKFMETYDYLVPHIYTPEASVMEEVLKAVDLTGAVEHIPRLWSDMVIFDLTERANLLSFCLETMVRNQPADGDKLVESFQTIAQGVWEKIENQPAHRTNKLSWTGEMLSNVMILFSRAGNLERATAVLKKLDKEQHSFIGEPNVEALCGYLDLCISEKDVPNVLWCLVYCAEMGFPEVSSMLKQVKSQVTLNELQLQKLDDLTRPEV